MYKKKMSLGSLPLQSFTLIKTVRIVISTVLCVCVCARMDAHTVGRSGGGGAGGGSQN